MDAAFVSGVEWPRVHAKKGGSGAVFTSLDPGQSLEGLSEQLVEGGTTQVESGS